MTAMWVIGGFIGLVCAWAWEKYVVPRRMTRPPADRILELIASGDTFSVHDSPTNEDNKASNNLVDYVVIDTERNVKTYLYRELLQRSCIFIGDLEWMNKWERERVLVLVQSICSDRRLKYEQACEVENKARNDRRREEARKFYENR